MVKRTASKIFQFHIELLEIEPKIWRRIQVPSDYTFYDLHSAIQDSMGWLGGHLHAFRVELPHGKAVDIGVPDEELDLIPILPGREMAIAAYFIEPDVEIQYDYDFGDGWEHRVLLEGIMIREDGVSYPRCIAGERACPPDDCGGIPGYYKLIEVLKDPKHPEYRKLVTWLNGDSESGNTYKPDEFDPEEVEFGDPEDRWELEFL